jgi:mycothiol synthase
MSAQIRNYCERDLELLVVLLNAAEAVDHIEQGTSVAEQREWLGRPGLKPAENAFVAEDQDGRIVGVAWMELVREPDENGFRAWLNVHPMSRGRGLEDRLLARLLERAEERMSEAETPRVYFACGGHAGYAERLRAFERAGMKEIRRFWTMRRARLEDLPSPRFAPDLIARNYRMGEDDAEARDALNDSFSEHFGHADETPAAWQHYLHSINYRPDLTVLALDPRRNRIAGFCHIAVNAGECQRLGRQRGWIDILGVRKEYRQHGLGEALILQGMHNLCAAGMQEAVLGCDSQNTTNATRLYFRVGFEVWREWIAYDKLLREPASQAKTARALTAS